jgi:adenosine deaminase
MRSSPITRLCLLLSFPLLALACGGAMARSADSDSASVREQQVDQAMQRATTQPARLRAFLQRMPKGGDLHNHAGGSIYAEDFLSWADADDLCLGVSDHALHAPPCGQGQVPARGLATRDPALYARTIDAMSMRNFVPTAQQPSGHDQFFSTFARFGAVGKRRRADILAATLEQAARDHVRYVELISNPEQTDMLGTRMQAQAWDRNDYGADLRRIQDALPALVKAAQADTARVDAQARQLLRCGRADASPACQVEYRYVTYVLRTLPQPFVFGQMALNYALVAAGDSRYVGVNIVAPEDDPVARADYRTHMAMFRFFSARYPQVKLSLHAGELTLGLVPPADLRFHIREAVQAGASRIGHGVDLPYEDDPQALLRSMRERQVAVEVNLTSNDVILGVRGGAHPLHMYLDAGVPVVLSTDDEGVSRIDMTHEYQRAVQEQHLDYPTLKRLARNGISYAFLPGQSLWQADGRPAPACAAALATADPGNARGDCAALLARSAKASVQWTLENDLAAFERGVLRSVP